MNLAAQIRANALSKYPGASVIARTRRGIVYTTGNPNQFMQTCTLSPLHIRNSDTEIDTAVVPADPILDAPWLHKMVLSDYHLFFAPGNDAFDSGEIVRYVHPVSGNEITFQPQQLQWINDLDQIEAVGDPATVSPTISDDSITFTGAFGTDLDFIWQLMADRLAKRLVIQNSAAIGAPPQFVIDGGNPALRLQFIFGLSAGVDIVVNDVIWNQNANNPQTTSSEVVFRDSITSENLWAFRVPWAEDADGGFTQGELHLRKQGANLIVDVRVPWSWLETAIYPVTVDPTTTEQAGASDEDAEENANDASFGSTGASMRATAHTTISFRWNCEFVAPLSTAVASGSTADDAYATVEVTNTSLDDPECDIGFEDVSDAADFTANADVTNRSQTTAVTRWSATGLGAVSVDSPSFTSSFQELIDSYSGLASGAYVGVMMKGDSAVVSSFSVRTYDHDAASAGQVTLVWTESGSSIPALDEGMLTGGLQPLSGGLG